MGRTTKDDYSFRNASDQNEVLSSPDLRRLYSVRDFGQIFQSQTKSNELEIYDHGR